MRAIHIVVLLAFGLGACAADELTEHATVPAFPETRDKAGVAYFFVEHNHSRRRFLTQAYDVNGNLFGELRVELTTARWPGQYNGYERPTRLRISMGSDTLELAYGAGDDADGFTMTSGGTVWQLDGNPAFPARCTPAEGTIVSAEALSILAGWRPLLADLSRHAGTVYGQWTGTTLMLNRSANLIAALSCLAGDITLCRAGPYSAKY